VTAHLEIWGLTSRASESPLEALEWVRAGERFDLAILDMHMPEMDGVALARAIRQVPAGATLPLVLFTRSAAARRARRTRASPRTSTSRSSPPSSSTRWSRSWPISRST